MRVPILPQVPHLELDAPPAMIDALPDNRVRVEVAAAERAAADHRRSGQGPGRSEPEPTTSGSLRVTRRLTPLLHVPRRNRPDQRLRPLEHHRRAVAVFPGVRRSVVHALRHDRRPASASIGRRISAAASTRPIAPTTATWWPAPMRLWDHLPCAHTQFGLIVEHRLATVYGGDEHANRGVGFARYVFDYGDSLYLPPMHYVRGLRRLPGQLPAVRQAVHLWGRALSAVGDDGPALSHRLPDAVLGPGRRLLLRRQLRGGRHAPPARRRDDQQLTERSLRAGGQRELLVLQVSAGLLRQLAVGDAARAARLRSGGIAEAGRVLHARRRRAVPRL